MSEFVKPHIDRSLPGPRVRTAARRRCLHPYPKKLFETHDVFPLLLLDGGAFFFTHEHIGGATGADFIAALDDGRLLKPWLVRGRIEWDKAYDETIGGPCRMAGEKHVWLNRLYFLLPIAWEFFRTHDEQRAACWFDYFTDWSKAHPYPEPAAGEAAGKPQGRAKMCWHDMQVTWRLLVLIHSVYLLEKSHRLKARQWAAIYGAVHRHALHVHGEASSELAAGKGRGNHFLQKGVALLYAGLLFPEFPEARAFVETGTAVVEQQMRTEIYPDGGSVEASPSYSHFIARLYLEAYLLIENNRRATIKGLKGVIQRQYQFLDETASPSARTLLLSDSYALDADADLRLVSRLVRFPRSTRSRSACFRDSCFAVLRSKRVQMFVDGMALGQWHHHYGKPNVVVYADGRPLLVDSGCSNYDLELRENWLKRPEAHNALVVSAEQQAGAFDPRGQAPVMHVAGFEQARERSAVMVVHKLISPQLQYEWTRTVLVRGAEVEIIDSVQSATAVYARQTFHLAPLNVGLSGDGRWATVQRPGGDVVIRQAGGPGPGPFHLEYRPAFDEDNRLTYSPQLSSLGYGTDVRFHVRISAP